MLNRNEYNVPKNFYISEKMNEDLKGYRFSDFVREAIQEKLDRQHEEIKKELEKRKKRLEEKIQSLEEE